MNKIINFITNRPWYILFVLLIITVLLGSGIRKIETVNNHDSELPKDDPIVVTIEKIEEIFDDKDIVLVALETKNVFTNETLSKIKGISEELKLIDGIIEDEITGLSTIDNIEGNEWGLEINPLFEDLPLSTPELDELQVTIKENPLIYKRLVSEKGTFTVIRANIAANYEQTKVADAIFSIAQKYEGNDKIYLAGDPIQQEEIDKGIQGDIRKLLPLALLLIVIGYCIAFRSVKGVVLPFLVVILSIVWTMGIMGHVGITMNVVTSTIPLLMIAVSSSYGIHVMHRYYEESINEKKKDAIIKSTRGILPAIVFTGLTSSSSLATLLVFKVASIRDFGIISSIGMLNIVVISLTLLPALLAVLKADDHKKGSNKTDRFDRFLDTISVISLRYRYLFLTITIVALLFSAYGISKVKVGNDFIEYFPQGHRLRTTFEKFNENIGGASYMELMVDATVEEGIKDPELLLAMDNLQQFIESKEGVGYVSSFSDVMKQINCELHNGDKEFYQVPDTREQIAQYLLLYSFSGNPSDFNTLVDYDYRRAKMTIMMTTTEQDTHRELYDAIQKHVKNHFPASVKVEFGGDVIFWLAQVRYIVTGKLQNTLLAMFIMFLFCLLFIKSFRGALLGLFSILLSSAITFAIMGVTGIRLETGTAIITSIGLGIGIDFTIHYFMRLLEIVRAGGVDTLENAVSITTKTTGKAIIYDLISNISGFGVFIFSGFVPLQNFGYLISLTMIVVALSVLVITPALLSILKPRFIMKWINKPDQENRSIAEAEHYSSVG